VSRDRESRGAVFYSNLRRLAQSLEEEKMKKRVLSILIALIVLGILTTGLTSAAAQFNFSQCANNPPTCNWTGGNVNTTKATYFEGMAVPQRLITTGINATSNNVHTLVFGLEWTGATNQSPAGSGHAYDFLTSFNQAVTLANLIANQSLNLNTCGASGGSSATDCTFLLSQYHVQVDVPDDSFLTGVYDPATPCGSSIQCRINAFESWLGNRQIDLYASAPITNATLTLRHVNTLGGTTIANGGDANATTWLEYTLTYTSVATETMMLAASHVAVGMDPNQPAQIWYGADYGGPSIFPGGGSPYHMALQTFDGASTGSMDNQMQIVDRKGLNLLTNLRTTALTVGQTITDSITATGSSGTPAGTVTFYICGPTSGSGFVPCTGGTQVGTVKTLSAGGTATSDPYTVSAVGNYCFRVAFVSNNSTYSNYGSWTTNGGSANGECFTAAAPTAVTLSSFDARIGSENAPDRVMLSWTTASEVNTAGFNIYRSDRADGPYIRINPQLIAGSSDSVTGGKYQYVDSNVVPGRTYYYQLEDVELNGTSVRHKPVAVTTPTVATNSAMTVVVGMWVGALGILSAGFLILRKRARMG
jgi:hypothetical protein